MQKKLDNQMVAAVVTTRNEGGVIKRLLKSIKTQSYKNIEIILVDNDSSDKTIEIAKNEYIKIFKHGLERSSQRNFGASKAKTKYLLFLDADMKLSKNVIKQCVELMRHNKEMGGIIIPERSEYLNYWEQVKAFERTFYNEKGDSITDAARFFPKKVFEKIGGFDDQIIGPEDWDITDRVRKYGYTIGRVKSKIYHFERIPSLFSLMRKKFYYGLALNKYLNKQGMSPISQKTVYFLRPIFYKRMDRILSKPILSLGLILMFLTESIGGALGYLIGRINAK